LYLFYLDFEASGEKDIVETPIGGFETGVDVGHFVEESSGEDVTETSIKQQTVKSSSSSYTAGKCSSSKVGDSSSSRSMPIINFNFYQQGDS
jgi:hypothetical protein